MTPPLDAASWADLHSAGDERSLRRAYARRLKQIDPEQDPQAFQALREAYEHALALLQQHEPASAAGLVVEDAPPAAEKVAPAPVGVDSARAPTPEQLCSDFVQTFYAEVDVREAAVVFDWIERLQQLLANEALDSLDARLGVERHLARVLAAGWQRGNEVLLQVCLRTFGWEQARTLDHLDEAAPTIGAAVADLITLSSLDPAIRQPLQELVRDLRVRGAAYTPAVDDLVARADLLHVLAGSLAGWAWVATDRAALERWLNLLQAAREHEHERPPVCRPRPAARPPAWAPRVLHSFGALIFLFGVMIAAWIGGELRDARLRDEAAHPAVGEPREGLWVEAASAPVASVGWQVRYVTSLAPGRALYAVLPPLAQTVPVALQRRFVSVAEDAAPPDPPPGWDARYLRTTQGRDHYLLLPANENH